MKLIINTVNLQIGGALQRSISFLNELKSFGKDEYHVFYSESIGSQIELEEFPSNFHFYYFEKSPASLKTRRKTISKFNKLEKILKPDIAFSFVGPAYWKPKFTTHLVGFGIPHIVYNDYSYVRNLSLKTKLEMVYKKFWTKYEADHFVVQTEDVKEKLAKNLSIPEKKIYIVTNGIGIQYKNTQIKKVKNDTKKLLLISRYRPSKNFEIINDVIEHLKKKSIKVEFHVTIEDIDFNRLFASNQDWVINHGPIKSKDCPELYNQCDAMFLPTQLECFSASYPEAMKMERPILTSDLSFAHTVCGDAALYFDNSNAKDIAEKIEMLFLDNGIYSKLVENGKERLKVFQSSKEQAESYIKICGEIINKERI